MFLNKFGGSSTADISKHKFEEVKVGNLKGTNSNGVILRKETKKVNDKSE